MSFTVNATVVHYRGKKASRGAMILEQGKDDEVLFAGSAGLKASRGARSFEKSEIETHQDLQQGVENAHIQR